MLCKLYTHQCYCGTLYKQKVLGILSLRIQDKILCYTVSLKLNIFFKISLSPYKSTLSVHYTSLHYQKLSSFLLQTSLS